MKDAISYIRVSSEDQADRGLVPGRPVRAARSLLQYKGLAPC